MYVLLDKISNNIIWDEKIWRRINLELFYSKLRLLNWHFQFFIQFFFIFIFRQIKYIETSMCNAKMILVTASSDSYWLISLLIFTKTIDRNLRASCHKTKKFCQVFIRPSWNRIEEHFNHWIVCWIRIFVFNVSLKIFDVNFSNSTDEQFKFIWQEPPDIFIRNYWIKTVTKSSYLLRNRLLQMIICV